jgi:hypothetical protein
VWRGNDLSTKQWLWEGYLACGEATLLTSQWKTTLVSVLVDRRLAGRDLPWYPTRWNRWVLVPGIGFHEDSPGEVCSPDDGCKGKITELPVSHGAVG